MAKAIYIYDGVMFDSLLTLARATNVEKSAYFCQAYYNRKCCDLNYLVKYYGGTEHIDKSNVITDKSGYMFYTKRAMKTYYSLYLHKDLSDIESDILETTLISYNAISSLTNHELKTERIISARALNRSLAQKGFNYNTTSSLTKHKQKKKCIKSTNTLDGVFTYKGFNYKNYAVFCSIYGIDLEQFEQLRSMGNDIDTIIQLIATKKLNDNKIKHIDYTGYNKFYKFYRNKNNIFLSREEMCNHWNISEDIFMQRVTHGISVGIALSTPPVEYFRGSISLGDTTYDNLYDLCQAYEFDLNFMVLFNKLRNNRRIGDILPERFIRRYNFINSLNLLNERKEREPVEPKPEEKQQIFNCEIEDSTKETKRTQQERKQERNVMRSRMSEVKCGVKEYNLRRRLGLTHEESFDVTFKDPFDNTFGKVRTMCSFYGTTPKCLQKLVDLGLDLKNALNQNKRDVADHKGNTYKNYNEMVKTYGLTQAIVIHRLANGWSLQEALEIPVSEE